MLDWAHLDKYNDSVDIYNKALEHRGPLACIVFMAFMDTSFLTGRER